DFVNFLAFSPDGKTLFLAHTDGSIGVREVAAGKEVRRLPGVKVQGLPFYGRGTFAFALAPDGKTLAAGGEGQPLRIWDMSTGKELHRRGDVVPEALAFAPDGKTLAFAEYLPGGMSTGQYSSWATRIRLWHIASAKELRKIDVTEGGQGGMFGYP